MKNIFGTFDSQETDELFLLVDLVETGDTMRAAGLEVVSEILQSEVQ